MTHSGSDSESHYDGEDLTDEDFIGRYDCNDPTTEGLPKSLNFAEGPEALYQKLDDLIEPIFRSLHSLEVDSSTDAMLQGIRNEYMLGKRAKPLKIAVFGEMASGKSTLINSLLSMGTVARKGDGGESCTWVVQSFVKRFAGQVVPFAAKIHFRSADQIRQMLLELLEKYIHGREDLATPGCLAAHRATCESDMSDTIDVLTSLFCQHPQFATVQSCQSYLDQIDLSGSLKQLSQMHDWALAMIAQHLGDEPYAFCQAKDIEDLNQELQPFTHRSDDQIAENQPGLWLLVESIEVGVATKLADHDITIVDAPGMSDTVEYRRQKALEQIRSADYILIVANIARAINDKALREQFDFVAREHNTEKIIIVLTHADTVDKDTQCSGSKVENAKQRELKQMIEKQEEKMKRLERKRRKTEKTQDTSTITQEMTRLQLQLQHTKAELGGLRVGLRNRRTVRAVIEKYRPRDQGKPDIAVFAVGNKAYQKYQEGYKLDDAPEIPIGATGVPRLREFLLALRAEDTKINITNAFRNLVPKILDTVVLQSSKIYLADNCEIQLTLQRQADRIVEECRALAALAKASLTLDVTDVMKTFKPTWIKGAERAVDSWNANHERQEHLDLLRRNGYRQWRFRVYEGPLVVNWSRELIDLGRPMLDAAFLKGHNKLEIGANELVSRLQKPLLAMLHKIQATESTAPELKQSLLDSLQRDIDSIRTVITSLLASCQKELQTVRNRATMYIHDGFMVKNFTGICETTKKILGNGKVERRLQTLKDESASSGNLWMTMAREIEQAGQLIIDDLVKALSQKLQENLTHTHLACQVVVDNQTNAVDFRKRETLTARLAKDAQVAKQKLAGPLHDLFTNCLKLHEAYSKSFDVSSSLF